MRPFAATAGAARRAASSAAPAASAAPAVAHDPASRSFTLALADGAVATLSYATPAPGVMDLHRTFVPPSGRGQGCAGKLADAAAAHAAAVGAAIKPTCSYIADSHAPKLLARGWSRDGAGLLRPPPPLK